MATTQGDEKAMASVEHVDNKVDTKVDVADSGSIMKDAGTDENLDRFGAVVNLSPEETALVRKLDWHIMPILWLMYFLNFLDRNAMVNGKLDDLAKDLKLKGNQYNTLVSILFVGYLLGQVPSNMILNRVKPAWYMSGFMMAWAVVSTLTCLVQNFEGMLAARFMLGVTEAPFYPGALYMVSQFYTRKEVAARMAIFYTGNMLASSFSGLIAAGVFAGLGGVHGISGWRWLFIIQGVVTVAVAAVGVVLLPNSPLETRWLTPEERQLAHSRMERDMTGRRAGTSTMVGLREACSDYRTWVFALMINLHLSANGFKNFMPTVVKTLGFSKTVTLVLTCPPFLLATFLSVIVSWSSGKFNERTWHITISKLIAIFGFALAWGSLNTAVRYFAMCVFVGATYGVNNIGMGWVSSTLGQTNEKKAVAVAIANTMGNLGSVYTPYLWPDGDAPRFATAMGASIGFSAGVIVVAWVMRFILMRANRRIKAEESETVNLYAY